METKTIINGLIPWFILSGPKNGYGKYKIQTLNEKMKNGVESINLDKVLKIDFKEDKKIKKLIFNK